MDGGFGIQVVDGDEVVVVVYDSARGKGGRVVGIGAEAVAPVEGFCWGVFVFFFCCLGLWRHEFCDLYVLLVSVYL